jgi:O-antigen/teichoic acid export membrane protein
MSARFSRNLVYNIIGSLLPIVSALITVPIYIHLIGAPRYGIVSIAWILLGYFGFLDFGLSRASANALGRLGYATSAERAPVFMTALYLNLIVGLMGSVVLFVVGSFLLRDAITISPDLRQETLAAFPWMVPMLPLGMVLGVPIGALESRERFFLSSLLLASGTMMGQMLPLLFALIFGNSLGVIIPSLLLARLLSVLLTFAIAVRLEWPIRPAGFHWGWARKLFGYGAWVSITGLISPVLDTFDQILIGRMLGAAAIAYYAVPMNLAMRSQVLATALARTLFPRISREGREAGRRIMAHATISLIYVFGAICAPAIFVVGPFLEIWVGHDFAQHARPIAQILMLGAWMSGIAFMPYNQLQAQGQPDLTAKVRAAEVVPFVIGLWLLISVSGLWGAAVAWAIRVGGDCFALLWLARCLEESSLLRTMPAVVLMGLSFGIVETVDLEPTVSLVLGAVASLVFLGFGLVLEPALEIYP